MRALVIEYQDRKTGLWYSAAVVKPRMEKHKLLWIIPYDRFADTRERMREEAHEQAESLAVNFHSVRIVETQSPGEFDPHARVIWRDGKWS